MHGGVGVPPRTSPEAACLRADAAHHQPRSKYRVSESPIIEGQALVIRASAGGRRGRTAGGDESTGGLRTGIRHRSGGGIGVTSKEGVALDSANVLWTHGGHFLGPFDDGW